VCSVFDVAVASGCSFEVVGGAPPGGRVFVTSIKVLRVTIAPNAVKNGLLNMVRWSSLLCIVEGCIGITENHEPP
jgi:hypothetical protein